MQSLGQYGSFDACVAFLPFMWLLKNKAKIATCRIKPTIVEKFDTTWLFFLRSLVGSPLLFQRRAMHFSFAVLFGSRIMSRRDCARSDWFSWLKELDTRRVTEKHTSFISNRIRNSPSLIFFAHYFGALLYLTFSLFFLYSGRHPMPLNPEELKNSTVWYKR